MKILNRFTRQRGIAIPIIAIMMLTMIAMIGLALDTGSAFLDNTRLQNAVDSAAISAAVKLNIDPVRNTANARKAGIAIFTEYISESNKSYIDNHYKSGGLVFEFSKTYYPDFVPGSAEPAFVRVTYDSGTNFKTYFMKILGVDSVTLDVTAVAGPVGLNCNVLPIAICATMTGDSENPNPLDSDCSDDACFGYNLYEKINLLHKTVCNNESCSEDDNLDAGNFGFINLPGLKGGKDIREALAEGVNACVSGDIVDTNPGIKWGNAEKGIADRIDGDKKTSEYTSTLNNFQSYLAADIDNQNGTNLYRERPVVIVDCRGLQNGSKEVPILTLGCIFVSEYAKNIGGNNPDLEQGKYIFGELTKECPGSGAINALNPSLIGPYKIILYKDERRTDS